MKPINTDIKYILAFGPAKAMITGYEKECDDIAKKDISRCMKFISLCAYIIRSDRNVLFKDARIIHSNISFDCESSFNIEDPIQLKMKNKTYELLKSWINKKEIIGNESFITGAAPIVPYQGLLFKQNNFIDNFNNVEDTSKTLIELLIDNIVDILKYSNQDIITAMNSDYSKILTLELPSNVIEYYKLAYLNYHNMLADVIDLRQLKDKLFKLNIENYKSFESMIEDMINNTNLDNNDFNIEYQYAIEALEDPTMDNRCNIAVNNILSINKIYREEEYKEAHKNKFNLQLILNKTANRFMKFDKYSNMFFTSNITKAKIININSFDKNRVIYEMSNETLACPFLDLRDYKIKVIVLNQYDNSVEIIEDFTSIY